MGRQPKVGLDFWLRDVRLFRDPKLRRPRQEYGYLALVVYEHLLDILYSDKGYYIDYRGEARDDVLWQLLEIVQGRYVVTAETLASVIDSLAACELFSGDLYRRGFITSKRAQKGYFSATLSRKSQQIDFDIWLLSEEEMRELNPSGNSFVLQSFISHREKRVFQPEKRVSQSESTQSREEQRRGEKNREEYSRAENSRECADALAVDLERVIGTEIDRNFRLDIARLMDMGMQDTVFLDAGRQTADKAPRKPAAYLRTILQGYERDGVWTVADLNATQKKPAPEHTLRDPDKPLYPGGPTAAELEDMERWRRDETIKARREELQNGGQSE
ncbi:DUF4373 domain-containing protein [Butyricicoccus faecihominis]|uniref:DUF4373 domain-containing protein n=1 Tax=Butyricicoccus faecihominis TaxID=1712515 RepID=UPI00247ACE31|nr:DUF4373 domain-containing protein [Butyricicoccus faecihominis]